ncbi:hypothetical protein YC2023_103432 [Brassica napus]
MTSLVPDLFSTAWSSSRGDGSCQTSDLKTLRRDFSFHSFGHHYPRPSGLKHAIFTALMLLPVLLHMLWI